MKREFTLIEMFIAFAFFAIIFSLLIGVGRQKAPEAKEILGVQTQWTWASKELGVRRTPTPEGWIIQNSYNNNLIYVPDSKHEWLMPKVEGE
jgi:hypothetical protein